MNQSLFLTEHGDVALVDLVDGSMAPDRALLLDTILSVAQLEIRDSQIRNRIDAEFADLIVNHWQIFGNITKNLLVEVRVLNDALGPVLTSSSLLVPIEFGATPVDALASSLLTPRLDATVPDGLVAKPYFLWLQNDGGRLKISSIPHEFHEEVYKSGRTEARRLRLLGDWYATSNTSQFQNIDRAHFWNEWVKRQEFAIVASQNQVEIATLQQAMMKAEERYNQGMNEYARIVEMAKRSSSSHSILVGILIVLDTFDLAVQAGNIFSSSSRQAARLEKTEGAVLLERMDTLQDEFKSQKNKIKRIEGKLDQLFRKVIEQDRALKSIFRKLKRPAPNLPAPPKPKLRESSALKDLA